MELESLLKSFMGSILTFLTWIAGVELEASFPDSQELSFRVAIVVGVVTLFYTLLKIYDWFCDHRKKNKTNEN